MKQLLTFIVLLGTSTALASNNELPFYWKTAPADLLKTLQTDTNLCILRENLCTMQEAAQSIKSENSDAGHPTTALDVDNTVSMLAEMPIEIKTS